MTIMTFFPRVPILSARLAAALRPSFVLPLRRRVVGGGRLGVGNFRRSLPGCGSDASSGRARRRSSVRCPAPRSIGRTATSVARAWLRNSKGPRTGPSTGDRSAVQRPAESGSTCEPREIASCPSASSGSASIYKERTSPWGVMTICTLPLPISEDDGEYSAGADRPSGRPAPTGRRPAVWRLAAVMLHCPAALAARRPAQSVGLGRRANRVARWNRC